MNYYEIGGVPIVSIENFYSKEENNLILKDLVSLSNFYSYDSDETGSAKDENSFLKKSSGIFLENLPKEALNDLSILNINKKIFNSNFVRLLEQKNFIFKYLNHHERVSSIVHYYENTDYYKFHVDKALLTILSWHYFEPKKFFGGNFYITHHDHGLKLNCSNGNLVIFPSFIFHRVEQINMIRKNLNKNLGRYSIATFIHA